MAKFGDLIDNHNPVLIEFYKEGMASSQASILNEVAKKMKDAAKIVRIDITKNRELAEVLRVDRLPTLMIYNKGEMVWRHNGTSSTEALIDKLREYL